MRKSAATLAWVILLVGLTAPLALAKDGYTLELFLGEQYNIPTPLTIRQSGEDPIHVSSARYASEAWTGLDSPYYSWRVAKWEGEKAWEVQLVHEKIILRNKPDEVQHFEISHGYNLITVNRAWKLPEQPDVVCRMGAGIVLTHPETTVRGESRGYGASFPKGFYLSGATAQAAIGKRFEMGSDVFLVAEAMFTVSYATHVPIADGHAEVPNAALHGMIGIGRAF